MFRILLSLTGATVFGILDAAFFLIAEVSVQNWIENNFPYFDQNMAELVSGAVSASVALFLATIIKRQLSTGYDLMEHPLLDVVGIFLGTLLVILFYVLLRSKVKRSQRIKQVK